MPSFYRHDQKSNEPILKEGNKKLYPTTEILGLLKTAAAKPPKIIRIQNSFFSLQRKRTDARFI
jgi:hypothetical protein